MAEFNMLECVKDFLGITDEYHDSAVSGCIEDVREYLHDAGVPESITQSRRCAGVVKRGVSDIWNNESGKTAFSPYFKERAAQLAMKWGAGE